MKLIYYLQLFTIVFFGFYTQTIVSQSTVCPSLDIYEIYQDPVVQEALNRAWVNSREGTVSEHEEGGWIVHIYNDIPDSSCKEYRTEIIFWGSGGVAGISSGSKPTIENGRIVADFHTHPGPFGEPEYINNLPSQSDMNASINNSIPGIIRYGTGSTSSNTNDIFYEGIIGYSYPSDDADIPITTLFPGVFDTRINSLIELENANLEAKNLEWLCEDHNNLPLSTREFNNAFERRSDVSPNPLVHVDQTLFFDYKLSLEIDFMSMYQITSNVYLNSGDGSLAILKEDMGAFDLIVSSMRTSSPEEFEMHYIILDVNNDESSKLAYYGEETGDFYEDELSMIGFSVKVENQIFTSCFFNGLQPIGEEASYEGNQYPWYKTEVTTRGERSEIQLAMKPTTLISDARYFNSFVGIYKDIQSKQNYLVVEYKSVGINAKLLSLEHLDEPVSIDISPYTILAEYDTRTRTSKYKEGTDLEYIQQAIDAANELYRDCVSNLEDETDASVERCWDQFMKPLKELYPHYF